MAPGKEVVRRVRLLFADEGAYHRETLALPSASLERYDRLIDCLREDPDVLARVHVDVQRLCAAYLVEDGDEGD
jgi:hypothetical protein